MNEIVKNGEESRIRKVLFNEVSLVLSIGATILAMVLFITRPQEEIERNLALINQKLDNHITHISAAIDQQCDVNDQQTEDITQIKIDIAKILEKLNK